MRHALHTATPDLRIPAHYLTPATQDFPYVFLSEDLAQGVSDQNLPVAAGATLMLDARYPNMDAYSMRDGLCEACSTPVRAEAGIVVEDGEGLSAYHIPCLLASDNLGLLPRAAVHLIPVE